MSSKNYSDERFEKVTDEIEELLGDLLGIEAAAKAVRDYIQQGQDSPDPEPKTTFQLTLPATRSFEVYPDLALVGSQSEHQAWIDGHFEYGKQSAVALAAWWRSWVTNYYLVDTEAIISAAATQADLVLAHGTQLDADLVEVSGNLAVHWDGDAKEEFFEWFPRASSVVTALLLYADAAQTSAGAAADVIAAVQQKMLRHAENCRDTLTEAVEAWRKDNDVFPFPPGSGYKFAEIGHAISAKIDDYVQNIPGDGIIVRGLEKATSEGIKEGLGKLPGGKQVTTTYDLLTKAEQYDTDETQPATGLELQTAFEKTLQQIVAEGDKALDKLSAKITALAKEVASEKLLILARLPRSPEGTYTA